MSGFLSGSKVIEKKDVDTYQNLWGEEDFKNEDESIKKRKEHYMWLTNKYYDLTTFFYGDFLSNL